MIPAPPTKGQAPSKAPPPSLRTISLAKSAWELETAAMAGSPQHSTAVASEGSAPAGGAGARARGYTSIFGLPMLSCCSRWYRCWSLVILLLDLTYSAVLLPISIGFQVNDLELTWACIVDLVAGAFFAAELVLGFHVGFLAKYGPQRREVLGGRAVAGYYVRKGTFWQDALSTGIWLTQIVLLALIHGGVAMPATVKTFQLVRIVRMVRFVGILRAMFAMTVSSGTSSILPGLRLGSPITHCVNILYAGLVLINFFGCLWNFIAIKEGFDNTWLNPVQQLVRQYAADGLSDLTPEELAGVPGPRRWLTGFYFALVTVATLGYGDIAPSTAAETAVDCFVIAFGVLMFGLIMGSIADQVAASSREARQAQLYREKMASVHAWMRNSNIPKPLRSKINAFYAEVWVRHASGVDASAVFFELPHKLRQELAWEANRGLMAVLPLFACLEEPVRYALSSFLAPLELTPGQELCLRGEMADRFWILHEGEVQVINDYDTVRTILAPAVLGESALLQTADPKYCVRPHGYRSGPGCSLWEVHLRDLMPFLAAHPAVLSTLCSAARGRLSRESVLSADAMSCGGSGSLGGLGVGVGLGLDSFGGGQEAAATTGAVAVAASRRGRVSKPTASLDECSPSASPAASPAASFSGGEAAGWQAETAGRGEVFGGGFGAAGGAAGGAGQGESMAGSWPAGEGAIEWERGHTCSEFGACPTGAYPTMDTPRSGAAEVGGEGVSTAGDNAASCSGSPGAESVQLGLNSFTAPRSVWISADGRAGVQLGSSSSAAAASSPFSAATAAGGGSSWQQQQQQDSDVGAGEAQPEEEEEEGSASPVSRGELRREVGALRRDLTSLLHQLSADVRQATWLSSFQGSAPHWAASAPDARRAMHRQPSDRRGTRLHSPGQPSSPSNLKWSFGHFS